jgi:amidase
MARTVRDTALMLSAIAGPDPRSPLAITEPGSRFAAPLERDFRGVRIAWSRDLGGLPVDRRVTATIDAQRHVFESLGCLIEEAEPDFTDADHVFKVLRAWTFSLAFSKADDDVLKQLKETVVWNIEQGRKLSAQQVGEAEIRRTQLYHRVREFMRDHEFLILPVNQVPPFDVKQRDVTEIAGQRMETYIDWMKSWPSAVPIRCPN